MLKAVLEAMLCWKLGVVHQVLFSMDTKTNAGMKTYTCAYVSMLEAYNSPRRPGHILHILYIQYYRAYSAYSESLCDCCTTWLDACQSTIVY